MTAPNSRKRLTSSETSTPIWAMTARSICYEPGL
jgi:hypothetical protein